jgi:hypothetical protein
MVWTHHGVIDQAWWLYINLEAEANGSRIWFPVKRRFWR